MAYCLIGEYYSILFGNAPENNEQIQLLCYSILGKSF